MGTSLHPKPSEGAFQKSSQKACHVSPGVWGLESPWPREAYSERLWLDFSLPAIEEKGAALPQWQAKVHALHQGPCGPEEGIGLGCFKRTLHRRTPEWEGKGPRRGLV